MVEIKEVKNNKMLRKFIDFPHSLYKNCPQYTPYIYEDEIANLKPGKNPANEHCDFKLFLAYRDGKIVGRVCAILNHYSNEKYNQKRIRFNRIDFIDDYEVSTALIQAVEQFGKEHGMTEINGPLGYSDQDKEGMLSKGFEYDNMFATFYTYPYYIEHMKKMGFEVDATWKEYRVYVPEKLDERLAKFSDSILKRFDLHLVQFQKKSQLKPYIKKVLSLTNVCYANLYGWVPIKENQMDHLADQYIPLINLDYLPIICDKNDNVVAFGIMIPTPVYALKKCNGHLFPIGWYHFLKALKKEKVLDLLLVAIDPNYQNRGLNAPIFVEVIKSCIKNGIKYAETGPELEYNTQVQALWKIFHTEQHKERVCFLKPLAKND